MNSAIDSQLNLFFGFFALWLSSVVKGMTSLNSLWLRYIAPMWMFGGYVYSWQQAYSMSHVVGYISLVNPMIYVMEGMRAAALGNANYLPFWVCIIVYVYHARLDNLAKFFVIRYSSRKTNHWNSKIFCIFN